KLIVYPRAGRVQLFDLQHDAAECKDLAAVPARAAELDRLLRLLRECQRQVGDTSLKVGAAAGRWNKGSFHARRAARADLVQLASGKPGRTTRHLRLREALGDGRNPAKRAGRRSWLTVGNHSRAYAPGSGCGCGRIPTRPWQRPCSWLMPSPSRFA